MIYFDVIPGKELGMKLMVFGSLLCVCRWYRVTDHRDLLAIVPALVPSV